MDQILEKPSGLTDVTDIEQEILNYQNKINIQKEDTEKDQNFTYDINFEFDEYLKIF